MYTYSIQVMIYTNPATTLEISKIPRCKIWNCLWVETKLSYTICVIFAQHLFAVATDSK